MAQNGHPQYYYGQQPPPQTQHHQDPYQQRPASYYPADDNAFSINGGQPETYQPSIPHRHASNATRQNEELFMGGGQQPPPPPPRASMYAQSGHNGQVSPGYNPSHYVPPAMSSPTHSQYSPAIARRPSFPQPYNPADYSENNIQRHGSSASYGSSAGYGTSIGYGTSPGYPVTSPPVAMPSYAQSSVAPNRSYTYANQRPTVQTSPYSPNSSSRPHYTPPAPPPLPAIPGSAESPSEDWGRMPQSQSHPMRYASTRNRYGDADILEGQSADSPPPAYGHPVGSRGSSVTHSHPPTPGPPPPPHNSFPHVADQYSQSRPLPQVPGTSSPPVPDYFSPSGAPRFNRPHDAMGAQADMEAEISGMLRHSPRVELNSHDINGGGYETGSSTDPEAAAGLAAMREADRQDREDANRRQSGQSGFAWHPPAQIQNQNPGYGHTTESDSDIPYVDLGSMGGGFDAHMSYGGDPNQLAIQRMDSQSGAHSSQPVSSSGSLRMPGIHNEYDEFGNTLHPFPAFTAARVDAVGTGGLADPTQFRNRRDSYDEGDDAHDSYLPPGEPPEMFYHPGPTNRPLPPPPGVEGLRHSASSSSAPYPHDWQQSQAEFPRAPSYPPTVNYQYQPLGPNRHQSLVSHTNTPQTLAPIRAKTDAEERRRREQRVSGHFPAEGTQPNSGNTSAVALDLPTLERKFNPTKLRPREFDRCREPWALSGITQWLKVMVEGEQYLKSQPLVDGLVALFTHKVPTMNIADAETLAARLVGQMQTNGTLKQEEEWFLFTDVPMTGVVFQLTGTGCYSPKVHDYPSSHRCYAYHCQRTEQKMDLSSQAGMVQDEDWATFFHLKKEDLEGHDKKEIERQNILHEIVQKEENYMRELDVLRKLYRDQLHAANPPLIPPKKLPDFLNRVFGKADAVKRSNEDHLLPQMKYRQKHQGPWVVGFSDIFREWIRKAKTAYIEYASSYPSAVYRIRQEMERNVLFRTFLDQCQVNPVSRRLGWDHYLKLPISRLQQVGLLLDTVLKRSILDNDERRNLLLAIDEIKAVTHECDARVGEGQRKADLIDLGQKLKLRPGMQGRVELNLDHLGRELVHKGDLLRIGTSKFTWLDTHAILFDHYLVMAKTVSERAHDTSKLERYDVSRLPIPMDLLVLESRDDDPVVRSGLTGRAGVAKVVPVADPRLMRAGATQSPGPGTLSHSNTSTSLSSLSTVKTNSAATPMVTSIDPKDDNKILYPFKVKHLGQEMYTLFAPSAQGRDDWCDKIVEAKTKHAAALFAQNAEPFKLKVIADSAFAYDGPLTGQKSIVITGTPLDRAIKDVEKMYAHKGRPGPVCRAKVNCATTFMQPFGNAMVAVGTDYGVYTSEVNNPRGWQRVITNPKVTQIAVLEDFSLFLLISDKSLIAYHLDVVCPVGGVPPANDNARKAPQKLSGSRDVGFFITGRMKDRTLVFYKKRDGISSTFKVLEPVLQKSSEKKSRFAPLRSGKTEFFRDFDEFYIPTECMGMNIFTSSLAVSTQKGFEILTLDKKQPISIPDLEQPHVAAIAAKLANQKPLGMFRLSDQEFLLVYEECAVYVNKHGDISRSVIMEFVGRAREVCVRGMFVLLFCGDFVEVRNKENGRLRQVVWGRDVKCLDDGGGGGQGAGDRSVKLAMQHPEIERVQVLVELVVNEALRE